MLLIGWSGLSLGMQILWVLSIAASLIFIIQTVMTFIGADTDLDLDALDGGGNLYTFRNIVNFLLGFGWSGIVLEKTIPSLGWRMLVCIVIGLIFVALVMSLFRWLSKMQQSGNIRLSEEAVGCKGEVYLPIPAAGAGKGKVQISINGSIREYDAMTSGEALPTGVPVVVTRVVDETTLEVARA